MPSKISQEAPGKSLSTYEQLSLELPKAEDGTSFPLSPELDGTADSHPTHMKAKSVGGCQQYHGDISHCMPILWDMLQCPWEVYVGSPPDKYL